MLLDRLLGVMEGVEVVIRVIEWWDCNAGWEEEFEFVSICGRLSCFGFLTFFCESLVHVGVIVFPVLVARFVVIFVSLSLTFKVS